MKSVLIAIRPKWVEKITSGEKTIEVRKTAPKEVPFKAYIYCCKGNNGNACYYRQVLLEQRRAKNGIAKKPNKKGHL